MIDKEELRQAIQSVLEAREVDEADEIADSVVDKLDEEGVFDTDEKDE